jgi:hypothetical protein
MKKYSFLVFVFIGAIACNKNVSKEMSSDNSSIYEVFPSDETIELNRKRKEIRDAEVLDPSYFPPPVIQTFEELDDWLEFNDNLVVALFTPGKSKPFFTLDEGLLQRLADHINESESVSYRLIGHTNSQGNSEENMVLSRHRAYAVWEIMINRYGVKMNKIGAYGEGETNPLNDSSTLEGRKANSRVELRRLK